MSFSNLKKIETEAKSNIFKPIYFVYGEEEFFHHELVSLFEKTVVDKAVVDLNTDVLYGDEVSGAQVLTACLSLPMMSEKRLVVVHSFESLTFADVDRFISYIQKPEQQTVALFIAKKINRTKKLHKALLQHAYCIEANPIKSEAELYHWIHSEFQKRKKQIKPEAVKLLYDHCGNNLYEMSSNIEKVITFTLNEDIVSSDHIEDIIGISKEFNAYELQESIIQRNKSKALSILKRLVEQGEDPIYLNSLIFYRFVKQWLVIQMKKENMPASQAAKVLSLPPFIANKYMATAAKFTMKQCNKSLLALKETDLKLKSTSTDSFQLLTFNILKILSF